MNLESFSQTYKKILTQYNASNKPPSKVMPPYDTISHTTQPQCTCVVQKESWHHTNGLVLERRGPTNYSIASPLTKEVHNLSPRPKQYRKWKHHRPPQHIPATCSSTSFNNVTNSKEYHQHETQWNHTNTQKDNSLIISNYIPIALANIIYEFYTKHPRLPPK